MSKQPEALRLRKRPPCASGPAVGRPGGLCGEAAAELRRLHAENEALIAANEQFSKRQEWWNERMFALEQQRDALLEALKLARSGLGDPDNLAVIDAAIAKATGGAA